MEKKSRYCPECGLKTNESTCVICGRSTKTMARRFEEENLYIIEDDISLEDRQVQLENRRDKEKGIQKTKALYQKHANHPESIVDEQRTRRTISRQTRRKSSKVLTTIVIIFVIINIVPSIFMGIYEIGKDIITDNGILEIDNNEIYDYFEYYPDNELDHDIMSIDTSEKYARIQNNTNMLVNFTYGTEAYWYTLFPYESNQDILSIDAEEIAIQSAEEYNANIQTIPYTLKHQQDEFFIKIEEESTLEEYQKIAKHLMACLLYNYYDDEVELVIQNEKTNEIYETITLDLDEYEIVIDDETYEFTFE